MRDFRPESEFYRAIFGHILHLHIAAGVSLFLLADGEKKITRFLNILSSGIIFICCISSCSQHIFVFFSRGITVNKTSTYDYVTMIS